MTILEKYGNSIIENNFSGERERIYMLNDEICKLREKLNESIIQKESYDKILKISIELDQLIAQHYSKKQKIS